MEFLKWTLLTLQVLSALMLVILVLLHSPKGEGIGGIGATAQIFSSQKGAEATLNKITGSVVGVFLLVSFVLGYYF
jgi:preprotein translocase subunit SecG